MASSDKYLHLSCRNYFKVIGKVFVVCGAVMDVVNKVFVLPSVLISFSACNCDATGSSNTTVCNQYGGECLCKPNLFGRQCTRCLPSHFNFSSGLGCSGKQRNISVFVICLYLVKIKGSLFPTYAGFPPRRGACRGCPVKQFSP